MRVARLRKAYVAIGAGGVAATIVQSLRDKEDKPRLI
jgi:hypothetical protein